MVPNLVGEIRFQNWTIPVYNDLNKPLFNVSDIADFLSYGDKSSRLLSLCEKDEIVNVPYDWNGRHALLRFVTESGLYNILSQSMMPVARKWRKVVHKELIQMRLQNGLNVSEQFEEWDHAADALFYDEETGQLMMSVTVPGGDVEQIPV